MSLRRPPCQVEMRCSAAVWPRGGAIPRFWWIVASWSEKRERCLLLVLAAWCRQSVTRSTSSPASRTRTSWRLCLTTAERGASSNGSPTTSFGVVSHGCEALLQVLEAHLNCASLSLIHSEVNYCPNPVTLSALGLEGHFQRDEKYLYELIFIEIMFVCFCCVHILRCIYNVYEFQLSSILHKQD